MSNSENTDHAEPPSEEALIARAQQAVSRCNWVVGECAAEWTQRYARGRTDADFGALVGLSGDQVYQRRRVWQRFGSCAGNWPSLRWSHFYVALNWDDAEECLQWAEENHATVAEMRAWRRALRGEDLTTEAPEWDEAEAFPVRSLPTEPTAVQLPDEHPPWETGEDDSAANSSSRAAVVNGHPRGLDDQYAPYRRGAGRPAPQTDEPQPAAATAAPPAEVAPDRQLARLTRALERVNRAFTPELAAAFPSLPDKLRQRFLEALEELQSKVAGAAGS